MDVTKLPKWAQQKIDLLERRITELMLARDAALNAVAGGQKTRVYVNGHTIRPNMYLPENHTITFVLDNKEEVSVNLIGDRIDVRTNWHRMEILPSAANHAEILSRRHNEK